MLFQKYTAVHCLFMLVHNALTNDATFDFNNVFINVEININ